MLGRFGEVLIAAFAGGGEPHGLEPRAHREPFVEGQPDDGSDLARAGVVPDPSHDLSGRGIAEVQTLDEVDDPGGVVRFSGVLVAPLRGVPEERCVPKFVRLLPVPVAGVPLEVENESGSEDPVEQGFLVGWGEILGQFEGCSVFFLSKEPDEFISIQGDGDRAGARSLDAPCVGGFPEFKYVGSVSGGLHDLVDPLRWSGSPGFLLVDPFIG